MTASFIKPELYNEEETTTMEGSEKMGLKDLESKCQSKKHYNRLEQLIEKAEVNIEDKDRIAMFYIIAGNDKLFNRIEKIYSFSQNMIKQDKGFILDNVGDLAESETNLLKIALDLYNHYDPYTEKESMIKMLEPLSLDNRKLLITALKISFIY